MSKRFRLVTIFFLVALVHFNTMAQDPAFSFRHPDCKVKVKLNKETEFLYSSLDEMSSKRGLNLIKMKNPKDVYKGEMYFSVSYRTIKKKLYDHCEVNLKLMLSKQDRKLLSTDTVLYDQKNIRSLPRITLEGKERCHRALKDTFIHIPTCIKQ